MSPINDIQLDITRITRTHYCCIILCLLKSVLGGGGLGEEAENIGGKQSVELRCCDRKASNNVDQTGWENIQLSLPRVTSTNTVALYLLVCPYAICLAGYVLSVFYHANSSLSTPQNAVISSAKYRTLGSTFLTTESTIFSCFCL